MPSALSAHKRAYLERKIHRHRFAGPFKWAKSADQIVSIRKFHSVPPRLLANVIKVNQAPSVKYSVGSALGPRT
jgi:hypothetical protein